MVKSTYVLDVEAADTLERLAREWQVSKSEALRRLIKSAGVASAPDRITLFRHLQASANLDRGRADAWAADVRTERHAVGQRRAARQK